MATKNLLFPTGTLCLLLFSYSSFSQQTPGKIDWGRDTVSTSNAESRKEKYHIYFEKDLRNVTPSIFIPVDKLKAIVDACAAAKLENIEFILAVIRPQDTARYFERHPLAAEHRPKVVNRQTILIKIPREVAGQISKSRLRRADKLITALYGLGYKPWEVEGGWPAGGSVYFDIGVICPPPSDCR